MTTFVQMIDRIETAVNDVANATWSTAVLATFLNDAIRDFSQHIPRIITTDVTTSADDRKYDLPDTFISVISVEYPIAKDPPEYLARKSYLDQFWDRNCFYDVVSRGDATNPSEIWISKKPLASETIRVDHRALHDLIADVTSISGTLTVVSQHEHILIKYVIIQCSKYLQMAEEGTPTTNSSVLMSQYSNNVLRHRQEYEDAMAQALFARSI